MSARFDPGVSNAKIGGKELKQVRLSYLSRELTHNPPLSVDEPSGRQSKEWILCRNRLRRIYSEWIGHSDLSSKAKGCLGNVCHCYPNE